MYLIHCSEAAAAATTDAQLSDAELAAKLAAEDLAVDASDELLARCLQKEFDKEYDAMIANKEKKFNGTSKGKSWAVLFIQKNYLDFCKWSFLKKLRQRAMRHIRYVIKEHFQNLAFLDSWCLCFCKPVYTQWVMWLISRWLASPSPDIFPGGHFGLS